MEKYKNLGGNSNVDCYSIFPDSIIVRFNDGAEYTYNIQKPGLAIVNEIKRLAKAGSGLNSYLKKVVGSNFASKR